MLLFYSDPPKAPHIPQNLLISLRGQIHYDTKGLVPKRKHSRPHSCPSKGLLTKLALGWCLNLNFRMVPTISRTDNKLPLPKLFEHTRWFVLNPCFLSGIWNFAVCQVEGVYMIGPQFTLSLPGWQHFSCVVTT